MASGGKLSTSLSIYMTVALLSIISLTSEARDILVGGRSNSWVVPATPGDSLNEWASANRFRVGDSLVWKYDASKDSVLQVTRNGYLSCNRTSPISEHKDGATVVKLEKSGPYYFISGAPGTCDEGERLIVIVLSEKHSDLSLPPAPVPGPASYDGPAMAPMTGSASDRHVDAALRGGLLGVLIMALGVLI